MKTRKRNWYAVWESEYAEEGSVVYRTHSAAAAKRAYRRWQDCGPEVPLSAKRITAAQLRARVDAMSAPPDGGAGGAAK